MNAPVKIAAMLTAFLLLACTDTLTSLGTMEGHSAFMSGDALLVSGADHDHRLPDGSSFSCADGAAFCRRAFLAAYDGSLKRIAVFEKELKCTDLRVTARSRGTGGHYLVAVDRTWVTATTGRGDHDIPLSRGNEGVCRKTLPCPPLTGRNGDTATAPEATETRPFFHVTVSALSPAFEELASVTVRSGTQKAIHAAFVSAGGGLYLAGLDADDALFIDRYDAESGDMADQWLYPDETGGLVVLFAMEGGFVHAVRHFPDAGDYRYLTLDGDGQLTNALTIEGDETLDPAPTVGERGTAALAREEGLYWLGIDNGLYRFVRSADTFAIETLATLDAGELSYQREIRFLGSHLYVLGANDRASRDQGCAYGEITTHETELVLEKFDSSFERIWEDRETEDADYRAIEILADGKKRHFIFQKGSRVILRPTE